MTTAEEILKKHGCNSGPFLDKIKAAMQEYAALTSPASGWVKASERLPDLNKEVCVRYCIGKKIKRSSGHWDGDDFWTDSAHDYQSFDKTELNQIEWLDETPLPTVGECMEYAKGLEDQPASKKIYILLPVNLMKTIQYAQKPK